MTVLSLFNSQRALAPEIDAALRADMIKFDRFMLFLILLHAPFACFVIPIGYGTWLFGVIGSAIACTGAILAYTLARGTVLCRFTMANLLAVYSATFIVQQFGRIEMHFHVFGSIAFLAIYRDWRVLLAPAPLVVLYHGALNLCQIYNLQLFGFPVMIFNYGVGFDIVLIHAGFVVFETSVLLYYAVVFRRQFVGQLEAHIDLQNRGRNAASQADRIGAAIVDSSGDLHRASQELSAVATDQSASIEEMSASFEQISATLDELANTARRQGGNLDALGSMQKVISQSADEVRRQLETVSAGSDEARTRANQAGRELTLMIESMETIDANSRQVRSIVAVINEIADRVNLLSLNASIEAARAGEYGRGFSVVAQEIARLADKTAASVSEINQLIDRNAIEVEAGRAKVNAGATVIRLMLEQIKKVGEGLAGLGGTISRQDSEFQRFSTEIVEMTDGVGRTLSALGEQAETGRHIQEAMAGLASMSQRLVTAAFSLNKIMDDNQTQATQLSDAVRALAQPNAPT